MRKWYPLIPLAAMIVFTIIVYPRLPDDMPLHWNVRGEIDGHGSRATGALLLPMVTLVVFALLRTLPRIDPRRENYEKFGPTYDLVVNAIVTFLALLQVVVLGAALGWPLPITRIVPAAAGVLFIVLGNVMPRARPNWWFGIRTPWTLTNDRVWERTHRVGGYLMIGAGLVCLGTALVPGPAASVVLLTSVFVSAFGSIVYSYIAWKQETSK